MVMLHIKLTGIMKFSNMVVNILPADPPPPPTLRGQKVKFHYFFSEQCHVAYQIKGNHEYSYLVANIFPHTPYPPPKGSTGQNSTFSEHDYVAYQINENHKMQQHSGKCFEGIRRKHLSEIILNFSLLRGTFSLNVYF